MGHIPVLILKHPLRIAELDLVYPLVGDAKISDSRHSCFGPFVKICDCKLLCTYGGGVLV